MTGPVHVEGKSMRGFVGVQRILELPVPSFRGNPCFALLWLRKGALEHEVDFSQLQCLGLKIRIVVAVTI